MPLPDGLTASASPGELVARAAAALARAHPLATIVGAIDAVPVVTHAVVVTDASGAAVHGHVDAADALAHLPEGTPIVVVFRGPDHRPPGWDVDAGEGQPTWHHQTAHVAGGLHHLGGDAIASFELTEPRWSLAPAEDRGRAATRPEHPRDAVDPVDVALREATTRDADDFLAAADRSRDLHADWVTPPTTREAYLEYLDRFADETQVSWLVRHRGDLAGVINVQNIVRGNYLGATLGYYAFLPHAGRGLLRVAVAKACDEVFGTLGLHRLEAGIRPANVRSIAVVRSLGFRYEAYLPRLVRHGGSWQDHELWVMTAEEWPGARAALTA